MNIEINNIKKNGLHIYGDILDKIKIESLHKKMIEARCFNSNLFLSQSEYLAQKDHFNANPTPTFNFLNNFSEDLAFIEENTKIVGTISNLLGSDYEIVIKKAVCGVPDYWLPKWVKEKIKDVNVANLGPYIKKDYQDITYFRGIDFHQDIIDWPEGRTDLDPSTFFTLYVYLHDVGEYDSPLHILPGSHKLGATLFPHYLKNLGENIWKYKDDCGNELECTDILLTGKAGYVILWHNCVLHGTKPVSHESEKFRISLRYLFGKSNKNKSNSMVNDINNEIVGELRPIRTRVDLDKKGKAIIRGNIINK